MQKSYEHRSVFKYTIHQPQNTYSLRDTGNNTTHMVFEYDLAIKLHTTTVEVGTSSDRNHRQYQVTMLRAPVLDLLTTKAFVLLVSRNELIPIRKFIRCLVI